jgi:hypothetical protein
MTCGRSHKGANAWQRAAPSRHAQGKSFSSSRSQSSSSSTSVSPSPASGEAAKAQLAKWMQEAKSSKAMADKKTAKQQFDKSLREFKYCEGNVCYDAVKQFCAANKLAPADEVELMQFIRYAREHGLIDEKTAKAAATRDVNTLCSVWVDKRGK